MTIINLVETFLSWESMLFLDENNTVPRSLWCKIPAYEIRTAIVDELVNNCIPKITFYGSLKHAWTTEPSGQQIRNGKTSAVGSIFASLTLSLVVYFLLNIAKT